MSVPTAMSFLFNTTFCALGASCVALGFTGTALATVDGGATADLLAVSGVGHRYATVIEADVQSECEDKGCRVYTVDLAKAEFRRQETAALSCYLRRKIGTGARRAV